MMSRAVAGVRKQTLILTLPGSPKGARENLLAVLKLLPHACHQISGQNSRSLHSGGTAKLENDLGIFPGAPSHHHHNHGHSHGRQHSHNGHTHPKAHTPFEDRPISNDTRAGASARYRKSPYPMLAVENAVDLIIKNSPGPVATQAKVDIALVGYVLAEDILSSEAVPAYRASIVDGYAIVIPSAPEANNKGVFPVQAVSHAASGDMSPLRAGHLARITTGAPLPPGANAIVMVEDTVLKTTTADGSEEATVEILTEDRFKDGENVREIGSDIRIGETLLKQGDEISAVGGELGLLASVGRSEAQVYRKPVVGVLSTGDEIIQHDQSAVLQRGEVRDCNRPTLLAAIRGWGYETVDLGIAKDKPGALEEHLRTAMRNVDVIVTSGGVSMGELDLLKPTIERALGGTIHFGRVSMKPGKPTTFATVPFKDSAGNHQAMKPVFSLPGNPASAVVTAHLFVLPCLQKMSGKQGPFGLPKSRAILEQDVKCDPTRPEYHRVGLVLGHDGTLRAISTGGQRSSRIGSLKGASGLLCLPAGGDTIWKGSSVDALVMGDLRGL